MPKGKITKKSYKKKTYKKTKSRVTGPFKSYVSNDPFPPSKNCRLHFAHLDSVAAGTTNIYGTQIGYFLNSLIEPKSGSTAQPYGFDQMRTLYRKYKVNAVEIKLTISDPTEDGLRFGAVIQAPDGAVSLTGAIQNRVAELPMAIVRDVADSGSQKTVIHQYFKMSTIAGLTNVQFDANIKDYSADFTGAPSKRPTLNIAVASTRASGSGSVICNTEFTFYCTFFERKVFASSTG